jgi:GMP synthase-like glutamine amidotransferase
MGRMTSQRHAGGHGLDSRRSDLAVHAPSRPVLVITHLPDPEVGLWTEVLAEHDLRSVHVSSDAGDPLPDIAAVSAIVSLGGQMSVTRLADHPFLRDEMELMRAALTSSTPVFGLCLGAQLLALAAGGRVTTMPQRYIGWPALTMTDAAARDPLFAGCPQSIPIIKWHVDAIDVTGAPGITMVATTATPGDAIFRVGACAWGSQMHLEADAAMLFERWLPDPIERDALRDSQLDLAAFERDSRAQLPAQIEAMRPVLGRFGEYVTRRQTETAGAA